MNSGNTNYKNKIFEGFQIQLNVIRALYYRELLTRITRIKFGLLGIFIEPLGGVIVWLVLIGYRRGFRPVFSLDLVIFLVIGNLTYQLFSQIARRSVNAVQANEALFYYRNVKPVDTIISRSIVEINSYGIVYLATILGYYFIFNKWRLDNLPLVFVSFLCAALVATGLGLVFMIAGHRYILVKQIVSIVFRPLYFVSGAFFPLATLPQWLKPFLSWNPLLQAIEIGRKGFSDDYLLDPLISLSYLLQITFIILTIGLFVYIKNERILLTR